MTTLEFLIRMAIMTAGLSVFLWLIFHLDTGDAELHEAARREKRRRQRDAWTTDDGRTIR